MSTFSLTPFEMGVLIFYATRPGLYTSSARDDLLGRTHAKLQETGLIDLEGIDPGGGMLGQKIITSKGDAWLERALATPLPVQKWVWE
jgi:hypothetical protein